MNRFFAILLCICLAVSAAMAQETPEVTATPAATPTPDLQQIRDRLHAVQKRQQEASTPQWEEEAVKQGATPEEIAEWRSLLQQIARELEIRIESLRTPETLRKEVQQWETAKNQLLTNGSPLEQADNLRQKIRDVSANLFVIESLESERRREVDENFDALKDAERAARTAAQEAATAEGTPEAARKEWLSHLAQLRVELAQVRYEVSQDDALNLERQSFYSQQKEIYEKQLAALKPSITVGEKDSERIASELDQRQQALQKHHQQIQNKLAGLASGEGDEARKRLESAEDTSRALTYHLHLIDRLRDIWNHRLNLWKSHTPETIAAASEAARKLRQEVAGWDPLLDSRLQSVRDDIAQTNAALAEADLPERRRTQLQKTLEILQKQEQALIQLSGEVRKALDLSQMLEEDIRHIQGRVDIEDRVRSTAKGFTDIVKSVWNFEVTSLDDTVIVNGQAIERKKPITIGMFIVALGAAIVGAIISSALCKLFRQRLVTRMRLDMSSAILFEKLSFYVLLALVIVFSLSLMRIPLTIFAFLGGAVALAIGFGSQQLVSNLISGFILLLERPVRIGDRIDVKGNSGVVIEIGTRCSRLRRADGVEILIPNSELLQNSVTNWTLSDHLVRYELLVGVAHGSPVEKAAQLLLNILKKHEGVVQDREPVVVFEDFGDSALILKALFWLNIKRRMDGLTVPSDLRFEIYRVFNENNISISFPQRDVHLDVTRPVPVEIIPPRPEKNNPYGTTP